VTGPWCRQRHARSTRQRAAIEDGSFSDEQKEILERSLSEAGVDHTIETYPAHHGFAVLDNPSYDADAAERHWKATEQFFGSTLGR
jgi:carboxymethylenebutenolidase